MPGSHLGVACGGANYSQPGNVIDPVPALQAAALVIANEQKQTRARALGSQFGQRVDRVAGPGPADFAVVDPHLWQVGKGQPGHGQPVLGGGQYSAAVPGLPGWQHTHLVQL